MPRAALALLLSALSASCSSTGGLAGPSPDPSIQVIPASEVDWQHLNPARGAASPSAGTLWGDRDDRGPTGFLLRPADGFESPPHIHNVSYRGVIRGVIHNDDPDAAELWMPAGSFWTQPRGHVHITAAEGEETLAYIEIEDGPYLVQPVEEAIDSGEVPVNVDVTNVTWIEGAAVTWTATGNDLAASGGARTALLWDSGVAGGPTGCFVSLPAGFRGVLDSAGASLRAVVVAGSPSVEGGPVLELGSGLAASGPARIELDAGSATCVLYVRVEGDLAVTATH